MNETFSIVLRKELNLVPLMPVFAVYLIKRLSDALKHRVGETVAISACLILKFSESIN